MVRLEEHKHYTEDKAIELAPLPKKVYIPLSQHIGKLCNPLVSVGEAVSVGQKIGAVDAHVYAPIHASISGKVIAIENFPHPVLGRCKAIVIEGDSNRMSNFTKLKDPEEVDKLSPEDIRNIVFESGIVGMGGASFPAHIKLNPPKPVECLIVNGAECEPYLNADYRLMVEKNQEILKGIDLVARCLKVKEVYIAIEDNKPEAIKVFSRRLPVAGRRLKILKSIYPQGGEKQLVKSVLGKEVPRGKLPFDAGVVVYNVATIFAIYEAVYLSKPLYERVVTVAGKCLGKPKNLLVRIGTPLKDLIDYCSPLKEELSKIIIGGPMMGIAQYTDQVPIIKSSNGVLLFTDKEAQYSEEEYCIRCGACVRECPAGLMPCLINLASEKELWQETINYGVSDCMECGICNYLCPANRRLVQSIKRAKLEMAK